MSKRRTQEWPMYLFTQPGQVAKLALADGFRFVVLVKGEAPTMIPINEPGSYEIDIPAEMSKGLYPVAVLTMDLAQVPAFEKIPAATIGRMLDAAAAHANAMAA